jgi:hypothetical protein
MQIQSLAPRSSKIQDFDAKLQVLHQWMQKQVVTLIGPFLSFILTFHEHKPHKILNVMLNPHFKGLKLVIQYVGNEITLWIEGEYDRYGLFLYLVHEYVLEFEPNCCN